MHRVVQEHQTAFPERRIEVLRDGDLTGDWDADRLAQAASNLIGNALQHGDADAPIQVRLDGAAEDFVTLTVSNAGGISRDLLPHLFDPFRGAERQTGRGEGRAEGLGLGLFIVQQIVSAHRGRVDVDAARDTHTVFRVRVPRRLLETVKL